MTVTNKLLAAAACAWAVSLHAETVDRRLDADARGEVEIVNVAGTVRVTGWDRNEVQVRAELGRDVERLDFKREGDHTLIKVVLPNNARHGDCDLVVQVPRESRLSINTVSATQTIDDVNGGQRLQTVSGDMHTHFGDGELQIKSVSGDVKAEVRVAKDKTVAPQIKITTVSGDVELDNASNEVDVHSVSGDLRVVATELSRVQLATTSGDLNLTGALVRDARVDAQSVSGDVALKLLGNLDAQFDIESFSGDIDNCFGQSAKRKREFGPGSELRFKAGEGHADVRVKTMSGDVSVCK